MKSFIALKTRAQKKAILEWLSEHDTQHRLAAQLSLRHATSCAWFLELDCFKVWGLGRTTTLWVHGSPGTGKTVLSSVMVAKLRETGLCLFYSCDHQAPSSWEPVSILQGLIKQITAAVNGTPTKLLALYGDHQRSSRASSPNKGRLMAVFEDLCKSNTDVKLIVDGLDECDNRRQAMQFFSSLPSLGVAVLVLSRKLPDIESGLHGWPSVEYSASECDLSPFIDSELDELELDLDSRLSPELRSTVKLQVLKRCDAV